MAKMMIPDGRSALAVAREAVKQLEIQDVIVTDAQGNESTKRKWVMKRSDVMNLINQSFLDAGVDRYDIKPNTAGAYYNMLSSEILKGESAYKHHTHTKRKVAKAEGKQYITKGEQMKLATASEGGLQPEVVTAETMASEAEAAIQIPLDAQWQAIAVDAEIEYFTSHKDAKAFKESHPEYKLKKVQR